MADVAQGRARLHRADAAPHRLEGGFDQAPGHDRRGTDVVHAAGVAVPAILDDGDVDIEDVAVLEDLARAGDAVADHVVDRGAHRLGVAAITDVGRDRALHLDDVVMADPVQFLGAHARLDVVADQVEHFGGQAAGDAHLFDFLGGLQVHGHGRIIADPARMLNGRRRERPGGPVPAPPRPWSHHRTGLPQPARRAILPRLTLPEPSGRPRRARSRRPAGPGEYTPDATPRAGVPLPTGAQAPGRKRVRPRKRQGGPTPESSKVRVLRKGPHIHVRTAQEKPRL